MRIALISDIHEDIRRLRQALAEIERRGVDEVVCLGDIVGYSVPFYSHFSERDADAVVDMVRANCSVVVVGNHDLYAIHKLPRHCGYFDYPRDWYELDYRQRQLHASGLVHLYEHNELSTLLSRRNREYLDSLPEFVIKDLGDHAIMLSHYAYPDCTGSATFEVRRPAHVAAHLEYLDTHGCWCGLSGNDHWDGCQVIDRADTSDVPFDVRHTMPQGSWVHGPAVCRGTTPNGFLIYDSGQRTVEAIPLGSGIHQPPAAI
jgi:predicted phosphodiesterase